MAKYQVTSPQGDSYVIEAPDSATEDQVLKYAQDQFQQKSRSWSDVPGEALRNAPSSAKNLVSGLYQAVRHPIDTGMNVLDAAAGGLRNALPESVVNFVEGGNPNPSAIRASQTASNVGEFFKNRYGGSEQVKNTLATDPVGAAADAASVLYGGGAAASRLPMLGKTGAAITKAGKIIDPISGAVKLTKAVGLPTAKLGADIIGGIGTHTGGESLKQATRSGYEGGKSAESFASNMRGKVPYTDVLQSTKENIAEMGRQKSAQYRIGMAQVSGDKTVLSFNGINNEIAKARDVVTFKGKVKNTKAAEKLREIAKEVNDWENLDPAQYHTPEGLDALKQKIGGIVDSIPMEEKTARMVGNNIYQSIKSEITKQAPTYAKVMQEYSDAAEQLREIEKTFSLGGKATADTAMRKLQSLMRNNANTNYGNRLNLMEDMQAQGGNQVLPALAGQSLDTWTPRGIGSAIAGGLSGTAGYLGGPAAALGTLAVQSPRLMGEAAFKLGQGARMLQKPTNALTAAGIDPAIAANILYQSGRLPQR